ncbi:MAG: DUF3575 domain-containing protein [Bacteroidota bacterium]
MKKLIFVSFLLLCLSQGFAQENLVKINPLGLAGRSLTLGYERVLQERQSLAVTLNISLGLPGATASLIEDALSSEGIDDGSIGLSGFVLTPQYRFYSAKNGAPKGFYVAPYLRYSSRTLAFGGQFDRIPTDVSFRLSGIGVGLQLGAQWIIGDKVSIDWYFLGLGANYNTLTATYISANASEIEGDIRAELTDLPIIGNGITTEIQGNELKARARAILPGFRSGISLGFAF